MGIEFHAEMIKTDVDYGLAPTEILGTLAQMHDEILNASLTATRLDGTRSQDFDMQLKYIAAVGAEAEKLVTDAGKLEEQVLQALNSSNAPLNAVEENANGCHETRRAYLQHNLTDKALEELFSSYSPNGVLVPQEALDGDVSPLSVADSTFLLNNENLPHLFAAIRYAWKRRLEAYLQTQLQVACEGDFSQVVARLVPLLEKDKKARPARTLMCTYEELSAVLHDFFTPPAGVTPSIIDLTSYSSRLSASIRQRLLQLITHLEGDINRSYHRHQLNVNIGSQSAPFNYHIGAIPMQLILKINHFAGVYLAQPKVEQEAKNQLLALLSLVSVLQENTSVLLLIYDIGKDCTHIKAAAKYLLKCRVPLQLNTKMISELELILSLVTSTTAPRVVSNASKNAVEGLNTLTTAVDKQGLVPVRSKLRELLESETAALTKGLSPTLLRKIQPAHSFISGDAAAKPGAAP